MLSDNYAITNTLQGFDTKNDTKRLCMDKSVSELNRK